MDEKNESSAIEIILLYTVFGESVDWNTGEREIDRIKEVEETDYPQFVRLGKWEDGEVLLFQPYLQAKIEGIYKKVDIAIKVSLSAIDEQIQKVKTKTGDIYQRYVNEDGTVYYIPPRKWEINKINKKLQETVISHYNTVGNEELQIVFANRVETMQLILGETEEETVFYKELVKDLIFVNQQLCVDEKSSVSMAMKWSDDLYTHTEKMVEEFREAFWVLERNTKAELQPYLTKQSFSKIKKQNTKTLIEHEVFRKDKVNTIAYKEQMDTFEHRVIRTYMEKLQRLIKLRQEIEIDVLEKEQLRLKSILNFSEEELDDKIKELNERMQKKGKDLLKKINEVVDEETELEEVYLQIQLSSQSDEGYFLDYDISRMCIRPRMILKPQYKEENAKTCKYGVITKAGWSGWKEYDLKTAQKTNYINFDIPLDCIDSAAFLYHHIDTSASELKKGEIIGVWGDVIPNYSKKKGDYAEYAFSFRNIKAITIFEKNKNGEPEKVRKKIKFDTVSEEEKIKYREELYARILELASRYDEENLEFFKEGAETQKVIHELGEKLKDKKKLAKRWKELEKTLKEIEETSFIRSVANIKTECRISNLFSFDPHYRKMYTIIKANHSNTDGIDFGLADEELKIAKLPELYEIWCCIKMLMLFIKEYNFRLRTINGEYEEDGIAGLKNFIKVVLEEKECLNGTKFELDSNEFPLGSMYVTIWYDREFQINKKVLRDKKIFHRKQHSRLRPDLFMQIKYGGISRMFVFDAKYRGNQCYDGIRELCEVAFQKYTQELGNGIRTEDEFGFWNLREKEIVSGAFILHSSANNKEYPSKIVSDVQGVKVEVTYNSKKYLGDYPDIWAKEWVSQANKWKWEVSSKWLEEWTKHTGTVRNNENKIGIITCNPKCNYLPYIIQMIMEKYFELYKAKCWICGGNVLSNEKFTEKGHRKFHIKCQNPECRKFMVETHCGNVACPSHVSKMRIGKHRENYYAKMKSEDPFACWNVSCPICRQTAPKRISYRGEVDFGVAAGYIDSPENGLVIAPFD